MVIKKAFKDVKKVLMEPSKKHIKNPYYVIQEANQSVLVVSPGLNGVEFNKTEGYISDYPGVQTYQCLYGQGLVLLQRNDEEGEAKEFKVVSLNFGRTVIVPVSYAMCLVNIGKTFLVVLGNIDVTSKDLDTKPIIEKQGFVYWVIEKKGEVGFEQNPNYRTHPQITTE